MVHEGQFRTNLSASSTGSNSSAFTEMESLANFSKLLTTWFFHQIRNLQRRVSNRNPKRKSKWFPPRKLRRRRWRTEGEPYISHDVLLMATVRATLLPLKLGPPSIFSTTSFHTRKFNCILNCGEHNKIADRHAILEHYVAPKILIYY